MGSYKCPLSGKLKPKTHDEWHGDMFSYDCPVLREEIETAAYQERYKRLRKLLKMGEEVGMLEN